MYMSLSSNPLLLIHKRRNHSVHCRHAVRIVFIAYIGAARRLHDNAVHVVNECEREREREREREIHICVDETYRRSRANDERRMGIFSGQSR